MDGDEPLDRMQELVVDPLCQRLKEISQAIKADEESGLSTTTYRLPYEIRAILWILKSLDYPKDSILEVPEIKELLEVFADDTGVFAEWYEDWDDDRDEVHGLVKTETFQT